MKRTTIYAMLFSLKGLKIAGIILSLMCCILVTVVNSDTIFLNNGGKLKCKEVIQGENNVICKFDQSQLMVKKEKIKEIKTEDTTELYENVSAKNQADDQSKTAGAESKLSSPEDAAQRIQTLETRYANDKTQVSKNFLAHGYNSEANTQYTNKNYKKSVEYLLKLEKLVPNSPETKLKLAYCYFMLSDLFLAEHYGKTARTLDQNYAEAYFLLGEIFYRQNNLNDARYEWENGLKLQPNPEYEKKLDKLNKELKLSNEHLKTNSYHFKINFDGDALNSNLTNAIINILEDQFKELSITLNYYPVEPITVIFYSNQDFREITKGPYWSAGVYDGKIRIPAKNIKITRELTPVLKHELVHALVSKKTNYNAPAWLEEGLADLLDGEQASFSQNLLQLPSLTDFPESFASFNSVEAKLLYEKSLSFMNFLQEQYGTWKILILLDELGDGKNIADAFQSAFMQSLSEVEQQWMARILEKQ